MGSNVTLRQLEYVVAVADTLGFHRAAARCGVSQSTLSAQIRKAEAALGRRLFLRNKRRVVVADGGAALVSRARRILADTDALVAQAHLLESVTSSDPLGAHDVSSAS